MMTIVLFPKDILQICMVGLALVIAVYTLVYPKIEGIMRKKAKKVVDLEIKFDKLRKEISKNGLSTKKYDEMFKEMNNIKEQSNTEQTPPFELFFGFIICIVLFSIPLVYLSFDWLGITILNFLEGGIIYLICFGILFLVLLFILIFVRLHSLAMANFDKQIKKIREEKERLIKTFF